MVNEYMLMSAPPGPVFHSVQAEKNFALSQLDKDTGIVGLPHLTILKLFANQELERSIVSKLGEAVSRHPCFQIELSDFATFPDHCIYLALKDEAPVHELAGSLRTCRNFLKARTGKAVQLVSKPHISIVRGLKSDAYGRLFDIYRDRSFSARYFVNELTLLRRNASAPRYAEVARIRLGAGGPGPKPEQLCLF